MDIDLFDYHLQMLNDKTILYYKGPFGEAALSKICNYTREYFADQPRSGHKIFAVLIELAQNIAYYSSEKEIFARTIEKGIGTIIIEDKGDRITFSAGNLGKTSIVCDIEAKCKKINAMNREELKRLKSEIRKQPRREGQKGGGIGLIQVAMKSENELTVTQKEVSDGYSFFMISTDVEKDNAA